MSDAVVRVVIGALRKVLGDTARTPHFIATVPRRGYRFLASVTAVDASATDHAEARLQRTASALPLKSCDACGQTVPMPAMFCPGCGQRMGGQSATGPPPHLEPAPPSAVPAPALAAMPAPAGALAETSPIPCVIPDGERKQVTVLFAEIAEALALIRDLDAEAAQQPRSRPARHAGGRAPV